MLLFLLSSSMADQHESNILQLPDTTQSPFANVRSSVVGLVNALQLPSDSNLFERLNLADGSLSSDEKICLLLDTVTIHCGEKTAVILKLHKTVADQALAQGCP